MSLNDNIYLCMLHSNQVCRSQSKSQRTSGHSYYTSTSVSENDSQIQMFYSMYYRPVCKQRNSLF